MVEHQPHEHVQAASPAAVLLHDGPPAPLPCPSLGGPTERKVVTEIGGPDAEALHDRLSRAGFRRSHNIAYAPVCPSCNACVPIRIPVALFEPGRTLKRIIRRNSLVEGFEVPARATTEQ